MTCFWRCCGRVIGGFLAWSGSVVLAATTYYLSPEGSRGNDGLSPQAPWQTLGEAIERLEAGDTLVLLPGIYFESVTARFAGSPEATTTIRAAEPGTAVLTGGIMSGPFQKVEGRVGLYVARLAYAPREIKELATGAFLEPCGDLTALEKTLGGYHYDPRNHLLFVHGTDGRDPHARAIQAQIFETGLHLLPNETGGQVHRVHLQGLVVHGFSGEGLKLSHARDARITHCRVYDTGRGIDLWSAQNTEVTDCLLYRNGDSFPFSEFGHVSFRGATMQGNAIRRCIAFDGRHQGLRFYAGTPRPGQADHAEATDNLTYDNRNSGVWFKSRLLAPESLGERNVTVGADHLAGSSTVAFRAPTRRFNTKISTIDSPLYPDPATLQYPDSAAGPGDLHVNVRTWAEAHFVDPIRHDYRLQADSPHRGAGPDGSDRGALPYRGEVFFVGPDGSDAQEGTSVRTAWRSLAHAAAQVQPGQTVYVLAGTYEETLRPARSGEVDRPIVFRTRGRDRVVLAGAGDRAIGVDLAQRSHIALEGFELTGFTRAAVRLRQSRAIRVAECIFRENAGHGLQLIEATDGRIERNTFWNNRDRQIIASGSLAGTAIDSNLFRGAKLLVLGADTLQSPGFYCNDNAFEPIGPVRYAFRAGERYAQRLGDWQAMTGLDHRSVETAARLVDPAVGDFRLSAESPLQARGRFALGIGARPVAPDQTLATGETQVHAQQVQVLALTPATATVTWFTPGQITETVLRYGTTPAMERQRVIRYRQSVFHYVALTGLEPGTTYFFQPVIGPDGGEAPGAVQVFTTPEIWPEARTFYVSPQGEDHRDGLSPQTAWRTPSHAALAVRAGDTVVLAGGRYHGVLEPVASGTAQRPIVFRAAEGERAELRGDGSSSDSASLRVRGLEHLVFEGFDFTGGNAHGQVALDQVDGITLRYCFFDRRAEGRINGLVGRGAHRIRIEDTVFHDTTYPIRFSQSPELDIVFDHCHFGVHGFLNLDVRASRRFVVRNSILLSNSAQKVTKGLPWIYFYDRAAFRSEHNLFWAMPGDRRRRLAAEGHGFYAHTRYTRIWEGIEALQASGLDHQSRLIDQGRLNRYPSPPDRAIGHYRYEDFLPAQDSPALAAGAEGADIGPRPYGPFQRQPRGTVVAEKTP